MKESKFLINQPELSPTLPVSTVYDALRKSDAIRFHRELKGYKPAPVYLLRELALKLGVKEIWAKDESQRFSLNSFKALGASYAVFKASEKLKSPCTFVCATEGNHGRAVAWAAKLFGHSAVVFVPENISVERVLSIQKEGAEVIKGKGNYDDAVRMAATQAELKGWYLVQDTAWDGYETIPVQIMAGYFTALQELEDLLHTPEQPAVDFVFLQAGVGSWAAAAVWYYQQQYGERSPTFICVEPKDANGLMKSVELNKLSFPSGGGNTKMAGLNCGIPSTVAFNILKTHVKLFTAVSDEWGKEAVNALEVPLGNDPKLRTGLAGGAGLAGLLALMQKKNEQLKEEMGINENSRILFFLTEGV